MTITTQNEWHTMSEEFEVRGAHEDRIDEAAEREPRGMAGQLAVVMAILATVGAG